MDKPDIHLPIERVGMIHIEKSSIRQIRPHDPECSSFKFSYVFLCRSYQLNYLVEWTEGIMNLGSLVRNYDFSKIDSSE